MPPIIHGMYQIKSNFFFVIYFGFVEARIMSEMSKKTRILAAVIAVAVLGIVAFGVYFVMNDNNSVGEYAEYTVSGSSGSTTFDGTMKMTIVDETLTQYKYEIKYDVYYARNGSRTLLPIETLTEWGDKGKSDDSSYGTKLRTETLVTKWGDKNVDVYQKTEGSTKSTAYLGDDEIPYKIVTSVNGLVLTFTLDKTNIF